MEIDFKCSHCGQDLSVDAAGAGTEIECPACKEMTLVPAASTEGQASPEGATVPKEEKEKHFSVPLRDKPADSLIAKPLPSLEAAAKEGIKLRIKSIRHSDCVEVGKDHFDEAVTRFLEKVGEPNVVKINTFNYTHMDLATRDWVTDYGVMIVYRG
jgi:DNA-directed RNA polymerase subunit RPC12/RpoP